MRGGCLSGGLGLGLKRGGPKTAPALSAPAIQVVPVISGTATEGETLSCDGGLWSGSPTVSYQWQSGGVDIPGAINSTYQLQASDVGNDILCLCSATNSAGASPNNPQASNTIAPIFSGRPVNSGAPTISGSALQGQTLTATSNGTWSNSPTSYTFQWLRDGAEIGGATASSYTLALADVDADITLEVAATNASGTSLTPAVSNSIGPVQSAVPACTANPTILGGHVVGDTLTVNSNGTWTNTPTAFDYQWQRNQVDIPGAINSDYAIQAADETTMLRVKVTASNAHGSGDGFSAEAGPVETTPVSVPSNVTPPTVAGLAETGQTITITDNGTWTNSPANYFFVFAWSDTADTAGYTDIPTHPNTDNSFDITSTYEGKYLFGGVVACNADGCGFAWTNILGPVPVIDVTAPTLSSPTAAETGSTTADLGVTTSEANGDWYWVVTTSSTAPTKAQVKAGQDHAGAAAVDSGAKPVSASGVQSDSASGLTAATAYYAHFMHEDDATLQSNVVSSAQFTTDAVAALAAPVLTPLTTTENPPLWRSTHDGDVIPWGSEDADSGDKWRLIWRLGGAGAWTSEAYQNLDDELFEVAPGEAGGFTWPLWEAAKPFPAGQVEVKEQRSRWVDGAMTLESPESNTQSFTVDAPAALWDPTDDSALTWYDASDLTTLFTDTAGTTPVTTDAQAVARWNDKGSNADHALQATSGDRPTYRAASEVNGLPGLRVNGGVNINAGMDIANTWSVLIDMLPNGAIDGIQALNATTTAAIGLGSDRLIVLQVASNGGGAGAGTAKWYSSGTQVGATTTGLTVAADRLFAVTLDLLTAGNFSAGRIIASQRLFNRNTDGRAADGDFRSIVMFGAQSDALRQRLEGFLAHNDGFTLPSGHPYEDGPPTV